MIDKIGTLNRKSCYDSQQSTKQILQQLKSAPKYWGRSGKRTRSKSGIKVYELNSWMHSNHKKQTPCILPSPRICSENPIWSNLPNSYTVSLNSAYLSFVAFFWIHLKVTHFSLYKSYVCWKKIKRKNLVSKCSGNKTDIQV